MACGIYVRTQGSNTNPLQWKRRVPFTRHPGKTLDSLALLHKFLVYHTEVLGYSHQVHDIIGNSFSYNRKFVILCLPSSKLLSFV